MTGITLHPQATARGVVVRKQVRAPRGPTRSSSPAAHASLPHQARYFNPMSRPAHPWGPAHPALQATPTPSSPVILSNKSQYMRYRQRTMASQRAAPPDKSSKPCDEAGLCRLYMNLLRERSSMEVKYVALHERIFDETARFLLSDPVACLTSARTLWQCLDPTCPLSFPSSAEFHTHLHHAHPTFVSKQVSVLVDDTSEIREAIQRCDALVASLQQEARKLDEAYSRLVESYKDDFLSLYRSTYVCAPKYALPDPLKSLPDPRGGGLGMGVANGPPAGAPPGVAPPLAGPNQPHGMGASSAPFPPVSPSGPPVTW